MRRRMGRGARHVLAAASVVLFTLPLVWMLSTSLKPVGAPDVSGGWWPQEIHWENYLTIFERVPMARYLRNSLIVTGVSVPVTVIVASLSGFVLAQLTGRWRSWMVYSSMALLIVPAASVWVFRFQVFSWSGLVDSLWALIIPAFAGGNPLYVLLFYWTYRRMPQEIVEAARLEGAGPVRAWWHVARPLARPTAGAVIVLATVYYWSDFVSPVLYIYQPRWYTLPVGLQILKQMDVTNWPLLMAGASVMTLPVIGLFLLLQRRFLSDRSLSNLLEGGP